MTLRVTSSVLIITAPGWQEYRPNKLCPRSALHHLRHERWRDCMGARVEPAHDEVGFEAGGTSPLERHGAPERHRVSGSIFAVAVFGDVSGVAVIFVRQKLAR